MNKIIGFVIGVIVIIGVIFLLLQQSKHTNQPASQSATHAVAVKPNTVVMQHYAFAPKNLKVKKGTTVTWINQDDTQHTVTADQGDVSGLSSDFFGKGQTFTYTFTKTGVFHYHCDPHPYMKGTVEVIE